MQGENVLHILQNGIPGAFGIIYTNSSSYVIFPGYAFINKWNQNKFIWGFP